MAAVSVKRSITTLYTLTTCTKPEKLTPSDGSVNFGSLSSLSTRDPDVLLLMLIYRKAPANEELTGIGKGTVLEILNAAPDSLLTMVGSLNAPLSEVVRQSTKLIASCYSRIAGNDTSEIRYNLEVLAAMSLVTRRAQLLQSSHLFHQAKRSQRTLNETIFRLASGRQRCC